MNSFNKKDVIKLAKAVVDPENMIHCDWATYSCLFCGVIINDLREEYIKHKINCPVLIAKDILTGVK